MKYVYKTLEGSFIMTAENFLFAFLPIIVVFGTLFLYAWAEESGSLRRLRMLLAAADRAVFLCLVQPAVLCGAISYVMNRCKQRGIHHFVTSRI